MSFIKQIVTVSLLLCSALAVVTKRTSPSVLHTCQNPLVADFDDLGDAAVPQIQRITDYKGLTYEGWGLSTAVDDEGYVNGIYPQSPKNAATVAATGTITTFKALTFNGYGKITAPTGKLFDINSFYMGCGLYQGNPKLPGIPIGCGVSIIGYDKDENQKTVKSINYSPQTQANLNDPNVLTKPFPGDRMIEVKLSSGDVDDDFTGLSSAVFGIATGGLGAPSTLLDVDNISFCLYSK